MTNFDWYIKPHSLLIALSMLLPTALGINNSALAAERIYASYSALERSISIAALEDYARKGIIDDDLAVYAQYVPPEQLAQLRQVLLRRVDVSPVAVAQFLYTTQGEALLEKLGLVITTEARQPGSLAIRAAMILAASDSEGLTLLNFLRKFPTRSVRIDLERGLQIARQLEALVNQTNRANAEIARLSVLRAQQEAQQQPEPTTLPNVQRRGPLNWTKRTLTLYDLPRRRIFLADVYVPIMQGVAPVIVISHGLGSDRTSFEYLATHLASHGFAVAVPNHPGSDAKQLESLLAGRASQVSAPNEFIDRPLDVKYLLDQLEQLNQTDPGFKGRLNAQQVGVIGQSFGGYTALTLAGATINFEQLKKDCAPDALGDTWNVSSFLQCRALEMTTTATTLQDQRVKGAIAVNPITSSVFGKVGMEQIKIPTMIVAGSDDTVAPSFPEQILPFTWLSSPQKYLLLMRGGTHFSVIGDVQNAQEPVRVPPAVIGPDTELTRNYLGTVSLAFFKNYITGRPDYLQYLTSKYVESLAQGQIGLSLVGSLSTNELEQALNGSIPQVQPSPLISPPVTP
jgi:predicted dienelactone hydrolase